MITPDSAGLVFFFLFAAVCAVSDLLTLSVHSAVLGTGTLFGILAAAAAGRDLPGILISLLPGLLALLTGWLSPGTIGSGDVWFLLAAGLYLEPGRIAGQLCSAIVLSGVVSLFLVTRGILKGRPGGNRKLPFLFFYFAGAAASEIVRIL